MQSNGKNPEKYKQNKSKGNKKINQKIRNPTQWKIKLQNNQTVCERAIASACTESICDRKWSCTIARSSSLTPFSAQQFVYYRLVYFCFGSTAQSPPHIQRLHSIHRTHQPEPHNTSIKLWGNKLFSHKRKRRRKRIKSEFVFYTYSMLFFCYYLKPVVCNV